MLIIITPIAITTTLNCFPFSSEFLYLVSTSLPLLTQLFSLVFLSFLFHASCVLSCFIPSFHHLRLFHPYAFMFFSFVTKPILSNLCQLRSCLSFKSHPKFYLLYISFSYSLINQLAFMNWVLIFFCRNKLSEQKFASDLVVFFCISSLT